MEYNIGVSTDGHLPERINSMRDYVFAAAVSVALLSSTVVGAENERPDKVLDDKTGITIVVKKGKSKETSEGKDGKKSAKEMFTPEVVITNPSMYNYSGNKGTLVFMAESTEENNVWKVLSSESFSVDLVAGETFRWEGTSFDIPAAPKNNKGNNKGKGKGGFEYSGYIFVLNNSKGEAAQVKSSSPKWTTNLNQVNGLKKGQECNLDTFK